MTIPPPALEIDGVSHRFGARVALDDLRFTLPAGRFTALLGVNGAGKTTLFNLICGLYGCGAGAIRICGHDIARTARPALAALGVVFQSRALDPELTVAENLRYAAALRGMARRAAAIRAEELMTRLDLQSRMKDRAGALSGGQFRRVEIAAALLHRPQLLLLDEPTAGLDIRARAAVADEIRRLIADEGAAALWATHLIDEIEPGDAVLALHQGRIVADGSAQEIAAGEPLGAAFLRLIGAQEAA